MSLQDIFNKFIGKEVQVVEKEILGCKYPYLVENDPVILDLVNSFKAVNGGNLRILMPGSMGLCDYVAERVSVYIDKAADEKYRIARFVTG